MEFTDENTKRGKNEQRKDTKSTVELGGTAMVGCSCTSMDNYQNNEEHIKYAMKLGAGMKEDNSLLESDKNKAERIKRLLRSTLVNLSAVLKNQRNGGVYVIVILIFVIVL